MSVNTPAQAGEGQINELVFYSNYNDPIDVSSGCLELNYFESILDDTVRFSGTFGDTGYRKGNENGSAAFERDDLIIYTDPAEFKSFLFEKDLTNTALLFMSSGNYGGLDLEEVKGLVK